MTCPARTVYPDLRRFGISRAQLRSGPGYLQILQSVLHPLHLTGGVLGGGAKLAEGPRQLGLDALYLLLQPGDGLV